MAESAELRISPAASQSLGLLLHVLHLSLWPFGFLPYILGFTVSRLASKRSCDAIVDISGWLITPCDNSCCAALLQALSHDSSP